MDSIGELLLLALLQFFVKGFECKRKRFHFVQNAKNVVISSFVIDFSQKFLYYYIVMWSAKKQA